MRRLWWSVGLLAAAACQNDVDRGIVEYAVNAAGKFINNGKVVKAQGSSASYSVIGLEFENAVANAKLDVEQGTLWFLRKAS